MGKIDSLVENDASFAAKTPGGVARPESAKGVALLLPTPFADSGRATPHLGDRQDLRYP